MNLFFILPIKMHVNDLFVVYSIRVFFFASKRLSDKPQISGPMTHPTPIRENRISMTNEKTKPLFAALVKSGFVNEYSYISRDADDMLVIRWPRFRVSCEIARDAVFVTSVPENARTPDEVLMKEYSSSNIVGICAHVDKLLNDVNVPEQARDKRI